MVGVGTEEVDLDANRYNFCSLLGRDKHSWGLSYYGKTQHEGVLCEVGRARFGQGSIIGLHLDTWRGTLTFYKNRQPLGGSEVLVVWGTPCLCNRTGSLSVRVSL